MNQTSKKRRRKGRQKRLVKEKPAAIFLDVSPALLQRDRWRKGDIPFVRIGKGAIRYDLDQLEQYIINKSNQQND